MVELNDSAVKRSILTYGDTQGSELAIFGVSAPDGSRTFAPCKIGKSVEKRSVLTLLYCMMLLVFPVQGTTAGIPGGFVYGCHTGTKSPDGFARRIRRRVAYMRIRRADTVGKLRRPGYLPVRACRGGRYKLRVTS